MTENWIVPIAQRAYLVITRLEMRFEERDGFLSDSDVLDAIDAWTTGTCPEDRACTHDDCCDYQKLAAMVWEWVEVAFA